MPPASTISHRRLRPARSVRRGYCYRLCSPSSVEEREALNEDDAADGASQLRREEDAKL